MVASLFYNMGVSICNYCGKTGIQERGGDWIPKGWYSQRICCEGHQILFNKLKYEQLENCDYCHGKIDTQKYNREVLHNQNSSYPGKKETLKYCSQNCGWSHKTDYFDTVVKPVPVSRVEIMRQVENGIKVHLKLYLDLKIIGNVMGYKGGLDYINTNRKYLSDSEYDQLLNDLKKNCPDGYEEYQDELKRKEEYDARGIIRNEIDKFKGEIRNEFLKTKYSFIDEINKIKSSFKKEIGKIKSTLKKL